MYDLKGQRFSRLLVLDRVKREGPGSIRWACRCDCGSEKIADSLLLRKGAVQSCGCLNREKSRERFKKLRSNYNIDLTGSTSAFLTYLREDERTTENERMIYVRCGCGTEKSVRACRYIDQSLKSCGCMRFASSGERCRMLGQRLLKDIIGQRFGRLIVVKRAENSTSSRKARWFCQCDCGGSTITSGTNLRRGTSSSCGCLSAEMTSQRWAVHRDQT
jgi:hypothetical protein